MEGHLNLWVNFFYQYQKKYVVLKDFLFIIYPSIDSDIKEKEYHIKCLITGESSQTHFKLDNIISNESLFFKCENDEDSTIWINSVMLQKSRYEKFIDDFYINNNSDKIFTENYFDHIEENFSINFSFQEFFRNIRNFLSIAESSLNYLNINYKLENILDIRDSSLKRIDFYLKEMEKACVLNVNENIVSKSFENNPTVIDQEHHDEDKNQSIMYRFQDLKTLFDELRVIISDCTFGINSNEIKFYIQNFKEKYLEKIQEVSAILESTESSVKLYLNYQVKSSLKKKIEDEYIIIENKDEIENARKILLNSSEKAEEDEEVLYNRIFMKEDLEYKISDLENQNEIIKQIMADITD